MLNKIAIIPEIFVADDLHALDRELDFLWDYIFDNCLIVIPKNDAWIDYIKAYMPSRLQAKTFGCIRRMMNAKRFIITNSSADDDWYKWGKRMLLEYNLDAIVLPTINRSLCECKEETIIDFPLRPSQESLINLKKSKCQIVQTKEDDLEKTLKPILEYARILRVIDPYVNIGTWSQSSISIASKLLGYSLKKEKSITCRFELFISEGKAKLTRKQAGESKELRKIWEPIWNIIRNNGHYFQIVVLGKQDGQKELHDRFILTDQCGVMLSTGFSCDKPAHPQVWMMLPENSYRIITDMYVSNPLYPVKNKFQFPLS